MPRLLPFLRRHTGALLAVGLLALLAAPSLAAARGTPTAAAQGLTLVICTTQGLVAVPLGEDGAPAPSAEHEHCAACLGRDLLLAGAPGALAAPVALLPGAAEQGASHRALPSPHLKPEARAPPALA